MFIALFTILGRWKQLKGLVTSDWISKTHLSIHCYMIQSQNGRRF